MASPFFIPTIRSRGRKTDVLRLLVAITTVCMFTIAAATAVEVQKGVEPADGTATISSPPSSLWTVALRALMDTDAPNASTAVPTVSPSPAPPTSSPPVARDSHPLTWQGIVTALTCVAILLVLSFNWVSCAVAMFGASVFLNVVGIITTLESLEGLMNKSVLTVQLLVVLIAPVARLPIVKTVMRRILFASPGRGEGGAAVATPSMSVASLKICLMAYVLSWFVGNIPVTAMLTPLIHQYCLENDLPSSQLLMPMEVATLIGGMFSKIGVSTTLLINGMMEARGMEPLSFFEPLKVAGVPALVALLYLTFAPRLLLPRSTKGVVNHVREQAKTFMGEFVVLQTSPMIGKRIEEIVAEFFADDTVSIIHVLQTDGTMIVAPEDSLSIQPLDVVGLSGSFSTLQYLARLLHLEWLQASDGGGLAGRLHHIPNSSAAADPSPNNNNNNSIAGLAATGGSSYGGSNHSASPKTMTGGGGFPPGGAGGNLGRSMSSAVMGESFARMSSAAHHRAATLRRSAAAMSVSSPSTGRGVAGGAAALRVSFSLAETTRQTYGVLGAHADGCLGDQDGHNDGPPTFAEVVLSPDAAVIGMSPADALRKYYHLAFLGLRRRNKNLMPSECSAMHLSLQSGDTLLLLGPSSVFERLYPRDFLVVTVVSDEHGGGDDSHASTHAVPQFLVVPKWFPFGRYFLNSASYVHHTPQTPGLLPPSSAKDAPHRLNPVSPTGTSTAVLVSTNGGSSGELSTSPRAGGGGSGVDVKAAERSPLLPQPTEAGAPVATPTFVTNDRYLKVVQIPKWYPYVALIIFFAAVATSIGGVELALCCEVAVIVTLALRLRSAEDLYHALKLEVFVIMAFSFGLGTAMTKSGLSRFIADKLSQSGLSGFPLLFVIALCSSGLSNIISSKAAVQVMFPVIVDICFELNENPLASIGVLVTSVINAFMTPYSHASALIIMGPGGYETKDFYRFGTPLNVLLALCFSAAAFVAYY